jgi:hypothetical protein
MPELVFHSKNPNYVPENIPNIISALRETGFIGKQWNNPESVQGKRYLIGDSFLSLVTFMGCAPAIELAPLEDAPESTEFCHVEVEEIKSEVEFIRGSDHIISRCPHCRQRHADWKNIPENLSYACDKCKVETPLSEYDWKNTAGVGRFFISLHGIYPQEALPTSNLLQTLEKISGTEWDYFYMVDTS